MRSHQLHVACQQGVSSHTIWHHITVMLLSIQWKKPPVASTSPNTYQQGAGWANFKDVTLCLLQRLVCGFHHQAIHNLTSFLDHTWDRWWLYLFWSCHACLPVHWLVPCLIKQLEGTAISIFIPPLNYDTGRSISANIPLLGVAWQWCQLPFPQPLQFRWVPNHLWPQ